MMLGYSIDDLDNMSNAVQSFLMLINISPTQMIKKEF
jgi:hypothetical protein